ncbi:glycosyl transferase family protein [Skermanella rosea]|uniref:glycosyl transferase family protein n=1 Tax=Skermanella rosea TaxID=1817965 RepID=UPI00193367BC|nr:glycosyl transferase family protein [Skermanella rosea]UEM01470.1 glycosyl transferase family protein [Skermanella rosea]
MQEHPFAEYTRALGKGPKLFRDLEEHEAEAAMAMVLRGEVDPIQLGAFLLLLRRKGETGAELAGFVRAAKSVLARPDDPIVPDLDWPSYADRHRQQPWFVLSALLLAAEGIKVLMHGIDGGAEGYAPTPAALARLGIHPCGSLTQAAAELRNSNFAYIRLQDFCPDLERLFQLRPLLGVRTAVNTFARDINPLDAPAQIQSVFHPPYRPLHQEIAIRLGQPRAAIFKGIGGEAQRSPLKECVVATVEDGQAAEELWAPRLAERMETTYQWRAEDLDPRHPALLWAGELDNPVAEQAVIATAAVGLRAVGRAASIEEAEAMAERLWRSRSPGRFHT